MGLLSVLWIVLCLVFVLTLGAIAVILYLVYQNRIDSSSQEPNQPPHENGKSSTSG
jgi:flagellar basal body-associated protein FliL